MAPCHTPASHPESPVRWSVTRAALEAAARRPGLRSGGTAIAGTLCTLLVQGTLMLALPADVAAQRKEGFANAVLALVDAVDVPHGGTRPEIDAALDRMATELAGWDRTVDEIAREIRAGLRGLAPADAARNLTTLAAIFFERGRLDDALATLRESHALDQTIHPAWVLEGLVHEARGDASAARDAFATAFRVAPSDPIAAYQVVRSSAGQRDADVPSPAIARLLGAHDALLTASPAAPPLRFFHAPLIDDESGGAPVFLPAVYDPFVQLIHRRRYDEALTTVREIVRRDPLYAGARTSEQFRREALRLVEEAEPDAAVARLTAAIEDDPSNERAHLSLALLLNDLGETKSAMAALDRARRQSGPSGAIAWGQVQVFQELGHFREFTEAIEDVVHHPPVIGAGKVLRSVGTVRAVNWRDDTRAAFAQNVAFNPNSPTAHVGLGDFYRTRGQDALATAEFVAAALLQPDIAEAHRHLGQMHLAAGRYQQAIQWLRHVTEHRPSDEGARYALSSALRLAGEMEASKRELAVYKKLFSRLSTARRLGVQLVVIRNEARLSLQKGDAARAVALMQPVIDTDPSVGIYHLELAGMLEKAGDTAAALRHFERARDLGTLPSVHLRLARLYKQLGDVTASREAIRTYTAAVSGGWRCQGGSCR